MTRVVGPGWAWWAAAVLAVCGSRAQDRKPKKERPAAAEARAELVRFLAEQGVHVDLDKRTIRIAARAIRPADPLEYLLIHRRGKSHEALLVTEVKPSVLNSAFLLLGYRKGKNARAEEIQPPPTPEQIEAGAPWLRVYPPQGEEVYLVVSWKGPDGEIVRRPAEDLVLDMTTGAPVADLAWIYLGGQMAPLYRGEKPVFVADYEGNLVSTCYMHPANHLITIRHRRGPDDQNWWVTDLAPPPGTEVEVTFFRDPPRPVQRRRASRAAGKTERAGKKDAPSPGKEKEDERRGGAPDRRERRRDEP